MRTLLLLLLSPLSLLITLLPYSSASPSPRTNPRFNDLPVDDDDAPKQNLQPGPQSRPHPTRAFVSGPVPQVLGTPIPLSPDPCGPPAGQDPRARPASESTCFSYVSKGLDDDHPFKLNCTTDKTGYTLNVENCRKSLNAVCSTLALGSFSDGVGRDRWVWAVAPVGECLFFPPSFLPFFGLLFLLPFSVYKAPKRLGEGVALSDAILILNFFRRRRQLHAWLLGAEGQRAASDLRPLQKRHFWADDLGL